jgi:hypothetical protein
VSEGARRPRVSYLLEGGLPRKGDLDELSIGARVITPTSGQDPIFGTMVFAFRRKWLNLTGAISSFLHSRGLRQRRRSRADPTKPARKTKTAECPFSIIWALCSATNDSVEFVPNGHSAPRRRARSVPVVNRSRTTRLS